MPRRISMAVPPTDVGLCAVADSLQPGWLNTDKPLSHFRQISIPRWLYKCSNSSFLPSTPFAFQQSRRRVLPVLLGRAAIFGHKDNDGFEDIPRADYPHGEGGDGGEESTSQFHTCLDGKLIEMPLNGERWCDEGLPPYSLMGIGQLRFYRLWLHV
jgi:hypothetical protein